MKRIFISKSAEETVKIGEEFSKRLKKGDTVAFYGELGSGKTTMIKGICRGFGIEKNVKSPSYVLLRIYKADYPIYHFDFYRINDKKELINAGYDEFFYNSGIALLEWADRVSDLLPASRYEVVMKIRGENEREIKILHTTNSEHQGVRNVKTEERKVNSE